MSGWVEVAPQENVKFETPQFIQVGLAQVCTTVSRPFERAGCSIVSFWLAPRETFQNSWCLCTLTSPDLLGVWAKWQAKEVLAFSDSTQEASLPGAVWEMVACHGSV